MQEGDARKLKLFIASDVDYVKQIAGLLLPDFTEV